MSLDAKSDIEGAVGAGEPTWGPSPDGLDLPYWEGMRVGELRFQRCDACGSWLGVPGWMCRACHGFELSWHPVGATGLIHSWIRTWRPAVAEYAETSALVTVLVELDDPATVRTLGVLVGDDAGIAIGQAVIGEPGQHDVPAWNLMCWRRAS